MSDLYLAFEPRAQMRRIEPYFPLVPRGCYGSMTGKVIVGGIIYRDQKRPCSWKRRAQGLRPAQDDL